LVLDDHANLEPLLRWMHGDLDWRSIVFNNESGLFGRPVSMASFLANAATTGESVYWMKATNLALHLACGVAFYALLSAWIRLGAFVPGLPDRAGRWMPCLATALWLLHPLLVSTVLYVVQRMAILATLFTLLAMLAYVRGRVALRNGRRRHGLLLLCAAVPMATILATLSKENGALAPALCGLMEWLVFGPAEGARRPPASRIFIGATLVAPPVAAGVLCMAGAPLLVGNYVNRDFSLVERLLTQSRVLWDYVGAILLPYGPRLGLYHDDFRLSHGLTDPPTTLIALLAWLLAFTGAWRLRRKVPGVALGLGVFVVGQALESTVFPLLMYFEHRVYLPSMGILWAATALVVAAGTSLKARMHHGKAIFTMAAVGLVLALGFATTARSGVWRTQRAILEQALQTHPDSRWLRMDMIAEDMSAHPPRTASALRHATHLAALPDPADKRFGALLLLSIECIENQATSSERIRQVFGGRVATIEPDLLVAYESLAGRVTKDPCPNLGPAQMADALSSMLDRAALPPGHRSMWRLRFQAARLYWSAGDPTRALEQGRIAWSGHPQDAAVPLFVAGMLLQMDRRSEATAMLAQARALIRPGDRTGARILGEYEAALAQPAPLD
jgi:hypothetical protein